MSVRNILPDPSLLKMDSGKKKSSIQERRQADKLRRQRQRSRNPEGLSFEKWIEWKRANHLQKEKKREGKRSSQRKEKEEENLPPHEREQKTLNMTDAQWRLLFKKVMETKPEIVSECMSMVDMEEVKREMDREEKRKREDEEMIASLSQNDKIEFLSLIEEEFPDFFWSAHTAYKSLPRKEGTSEKEELERLTDFLMREHKHNRNVPELIRLWRSGKSKEKGGEENQDESKGSDKKEEISDEFWKLLGETGKEEFPKIILPVWLKELAEDLPQEFLDLVENFDRKELGKGSQGAALPEWQRSLLKNDPDKFLQLCRADGENETSEDYEEEESSSSNEGGDSIHYSEVASDDASNGSSSEDSSEESNEEDHDLSDQSAEDDDELEDTDSYEDEQFLENVPSPSVSPPLERYSPPHHRYSPPHVEEAPVYEARYSPSQPDAGCSYSPPSYSDSEDTPPSFSDDYSDFSE